MQIIQGDKIRLKVKKKTFIIKTYNYISHKYSRRNRISIFNNHQIKEIDKTNHKNFSKSKFSELNLIQDV